MRVIEVPAPITVKSPDGSNSEAVSFKKFALLQLDLYADIKTVTQARQAQKVVDAIERGNGTISLEDAEYDLLKSALDKVNGIPGVYRQCLAFVDAVDKAQELKK